MTSPTRETELLARGDHRFVLLIAASAAAHTLVISVIDDVPRTLPEVPVPDVVEVVILDGASDHHRALARLDLQPVAPAAKHQASGPGDRPIPAAATPAGTPLQPIRPEAADPVAPEDVLPAAAPWPENQLKPVLPSPGSAVTSEVAMLQPTDRVPAAVTVPPATPLQSVRPEGSVSVPPQGELPAAAPSPENQLKPVLPSPGPAVTSEVAMLQPTGRVPAAVTVPPATPLQSVRPDASNTLALEAGSPPAVLPEPVPGPSQPVPLLPRNHVVSTNAGENSLPPASFGAPVVPSRTTPARLTPVAAPSERHGAPANRDPVPFAYPVPAPTAGAPPQNSAAQVGSPLASVGPQDVIAAIPAVSPPDHVSSSAPPPPLATVNADGTAVAAMDFHALLDEQIARLSCAAITVAFNRTAGENALAGFTSSEHELAGLVDTLTGLSEAFVPDVQGVKFMPEPFCSVLAAVHRTGARPSRAQKEIAPSGAGVHRFQEGDVFRMGMLTPEFDGFVYIDYFTQFGEVAHLISQTTEAADNLFARDQWLQIGGHDGVGRHAVITAPFGLDWVLGIASTHPLGLVGRPQSEPTADYLPALERALLELKQRHPDAIAEYVHRFVQTGPALSPTGPE